MNIIDLDAKVQAWAMDYLVINLPKSRGKFPKERLKIDVDWSRVYFNHSETCYKDDQRIVPLPKTNNLFSTSFTNHTDSDQNYCFSTSRSTTSTIDIDISHTYTKEKHLDLKMKIPSSLVEAGAGFKKQLSITNDMRQTIQEEMTWSVNMDVKVKPGYIGKAEVKVQEKKLASVFTINTEITGNIFVIYRDVKKNMALIAQVSESIVRILKNKLQPAVMIEKTKEMNYQIFNDKIIIRTVGSSLFRFGSEQDVQIHYEKIN